MEERLRMGLDILLRLAHIIQEDVFNTPFLATEHGCKDFSEPLKLENTSILISVPSKLEPYPGRTGRNSWMGDKAVRFWKEQRGTVPAEGAAPAAAQEAAPAAEGGAALAAAQEAAPAAEGGAALAAAQEAAPAAEGGAALAAGAAQKAVATAAEGAAATADGGAAAAADEAHGGAAAAADADGPGGAAIGADGGAAAADSTPRIGKVRSLLLPPTGTEIMTFFQPHNIMADTREGAGGP